jgi:hypothetical protein
MKEKSRYGYQVLSEFWLKLIAIVSMTFDHVGYFLNNYSSFFANSELVDNLSIAFRIIGRLSFPLFAFMLAEGLRHTSDRKKYLLRLVDVWALIFAVELAMYIFAVTGSSPLGYPPNQVFTSLVLYALFVILIERKDWKKWLSVLPVLYILVTYAADISYIYAPYATGSAASALSWQTYLPLFIRPQYSLFGFLVFLGFYYARPLADRFLKRSLSLTDEALDDYKQTKDYQALINIVSALTFALTTVVFWGLSYIKTPAAPYSFDTFKMGWQTYGLVSALLILCYTGKRGYDKPWFRWFSYLYYPAHIAIIAIVFGLIFN